MTTPVNPASPAAARAQDIDALPIGTVMHDYTITGIIGRGGFGLVYVARDGRTQRSVAIKEFFPAAIAGRAADGNIAPRSEQLLNAFARGLKGFLQEAERLAEFSHPALVTVHRAWEMYGTAYMAMQYYPGRTLREVRLATKEGMSDAHIRHLISPIFDALSELHAHRVIHRDVSPDNILVMPSGDTVLLDLGAARQVLGGMTQALTTILKPGFAPIEQYVDDGSMEQGRWTDVYGLGAVIYFLATGVPPTSATSRVVRDVLPSVADLAKGFTCSIEFETAVTRALSLRAIERYKSIGEFRNALGWVAAAPSKNVASAETPTQSAPRDANETTQVLAAFSAEEILRKTAPTDAHVAASSFEKVQTAGANVGPTVAKASAAQVAANAKVRRAPPKPATLPPPPESRVIWWVGVGIGFLLGVFVIWKLFGR
jgi:serine/threonine protein kinase